MATSEISEQAYRFVVDEIEKVLAKGMQPTLSDEAWKALTEAVCVKRPSGEIDETVYQITCGDFAAKDLKDWFEKCAQILLLSSENEDRVKGLDCFHAAKAIAATLRK